MLKFIVYGLLLTSTAAKSQSTGFLGWKNVKNKRYARYQGKPVTAEDLPASFDWRDSSLFSNPIKNQGACGSCWAFAITKSLELSLLMKEQSETLNLSEQHMVSCERSAYGCSGGYMESAIFVVNSGLAGEEDFPYRAANVACKKGLQVKARASSYVLLGSANKAPEVDAIKSAIMKYGSVFVTVSAGGSGWSSSGDRVTGCRNRSTNHMVNLVGWTANREWIMANSWSDKWKDGGYAKVPFGCDLIAREAGYIEVE